MRKDLHRHVKNCSVLHMDSSNEIGLLIQRARTRKRMTQAELADLIGVSRMSVNRWERGRTLPQQYAGVVEEVLEITIPAFDVKASA